MFFHCESVQSFWSDMQSWLQSREAELRPLTVKTVTFGVFAENRDLDFVLNTVLLLGKFLYINVDTLSPNPV